MSGQLERVVRRARFPFLKTIDDSNFLYQSTVRLSLLGYAPSADFTTEGHCVIFNGKPGRGKTHLAIAIAYRAIHHGFDALFVTAAELIDDLSTSVCAGRFAAYLLGEQVERFTKPVGIVIIVGAVAGGMLSIRFIDGHEVTLEAEAERMLAGPLR